MKKNGFHTRDWTEFQKDQRHQEDEFPSLSTLSAAFIYDFLPNPKERKPLELVHWNCDGEDVHKTLSALVRWNMCWEAGQFRPSVENKDFPESMKKLVSQEERNIYLLPNYKKHSYGKYAVLHHLLPVRLLQKYQLPFITNANWPVHSAFEDKSNFSSYYNTRLQMAFAEYIWPFLNSRGHISSFTQDDPLKLLGHNLDFWLGPTFKYIEDSLLTRNFVDNKSFEKNEKLEEILANGPYEDVDVCRPRFGGPIWYGEEESEEATRNIFELADRAGNLRGIIDLVRSHRIQDDFSSRWSYEKEDFERKLYSKRNKIKVNFVELNETIPLISPDTEIHEDLMWEDFMALLDPKEKSITVCLRNGQTKLGEIARDLGYANHSPVSKALNKIRKKAKNYFDNVR